MAKLLVIDDAERERIRAALKRYKADHDDIGDPELQERMLGAHAKLTAAKHVDYSYIPLSTLQRFLRGKGRTEDRMVRRYKTFLETEKPPPSYVNLGDAIAAFFSNVPRREGRDKFNERLQSFFSRTYRCYLKGEREYLGEPFEHPDFPIIDDPGGPAYHVPYSTLEFQRLAGTPYLRVIERVYNPDRDALLADVETKLLPGPQHFFEGIATASDEDHVLLIALRSIGEGFQYPRFYLLERLNPKAQATSPLLGSCLSTNIAFEAANFCRSFEVKLYPIPEAAP